ncbi:MAG TPA: hypothetical protein VF121_01175 [Thermoanaerobaculia bacterium]|nr:hypothetical protein [Thermoanaerobaculia bacterium]
MARRSLTLVVDEELLQQARSVAARRRTTVNELVRQLLERLTDDEQRLAAWDSIRPLIDEGPVRIGGALPSRDELHER